jgi:metallo-beta-lactamase class B
MMRILFGILLALTSTVVTAADLSNCTLCKKWNEDQVPFRVFGNTWYVGVHGLSSILITSPQGDVLIDGDLEISPPEIENHIRKLGVHLGDIRLILNSHVHFDHAGGLAALQEATGAPVAASPWSAAVLKSGGVAKDDPQHGVLYPISPVARVRAVHDGETLHVGSIAITAHFTPGHTPGGTSWTWRSCEGSRCLNMVYADSLSPISAPDFKFSDKVHHPRVLAEFQRSFRVIASLPCDILMTPHPGRSHTWRRLAERKAGNADAFIDTSACKAYINAARKRLAGRLAKEQAVRKPQTSLDK